MTTQSVDLDFAARSSDQTSKPLQRQAEAVKPLGLPPVGARMMNKHGIEWQVVNHGLFPRPAALARDPENGDCLPLICPSNISERLASFFNETDHCTSKQILFIDTMAASHPFGPGQNVHYAISSSNPDASYILLDAATVHETTVAHEIAHLWLNYVQEGGDGMRRLRERAWNPARYMQLNLVQSFVVDLRVNDLIAERGFDMSLITDDYIRALTALRDAVALGYQPPTSREALLHSLAIADAILEQKRWPDEDKQRLTGLLSFFEAAAPQVYRVAMELVEIVRRCGYESSRAIRKALDECITLAFRATGDDLDIERDLEESPLVEGTRDKYPDELPGCPVPLKLAIGRILARERISFPCGILIGSTASGMVQIMTEDESGAKRGPLAVNYKVTPPHLLIDSPNSLPSSPHANGMPAYSHRRPPSAWYANTIQAKEYDPFKSKEPASSAPASKYFAGSVGHYMAGLALSIATARLAQLQGVDSANLYQYAYNNAITYVDPEGQTPTGASDPSGSSGELIRASPVRFSGSCKNVESFVQRNMNFKGPVGVFVQRLTWTYSISTCSGEPLHPADMPRSGSVWYEGLINVSPYVQDVRGLYRNVTASKGFIRVSNESAYIANKHELLTPPWSHSPPVEGVISQVPIAQHLPPSWKFSPFNHGQTILEWDCCCSKKFVRGKSV